MITFFILFNFACCTCRYLGVTKTNAFHRVVINCFQGFCSALTSRIIRLQIKIKIGLVLVGLPNFSPLSSLGRSAHVWHKVVAGQTLCSELFSLVIVFYWYNIKHVTFSQTLLFFFQLLRLLLQKISFLLKGHRSSYLIKIHFIVEIQSSGITNLKVNALTPTNDSDFFERPVDKTHILAALLLKIGLAL